MRCFASQCVSSHRPYHLVLAQPFVKAAIGKEIHRRIERFVDIYNLKRVSVSRFGLHFLDESRSNPLISMCLIHSDLGDAAKIGGKNNVTNASVIDEGTQYPLPRPAAADGGDRVLPRRLAIPKRRQQIPIRFGNFANLGGLRQPVNDFDRGVALNES